MTIFNVNHQATDFGNYNVLLHFTREKLNTKIRYSFLLKTKLRCGSDDGFFETFKNVLKQNPEITCEAAKKARLVKGLNTNKFFETNSTIR